MTVLLLLSCGLNAVSQEVIQLNNPSFEDTPSDATTPMGWFECTDSTTPDILPGFWGVYNESSDGETYIGMITRENKSWEAIGQRLSIPLSAGECYQFSLDLAHSYSYAGYNEPICLAIYIGEEKCGQMQLIDKTDPIKNRDWEKRTIKFTPQKQARYILLEVTYPKGESKTKGNLLIDNVSSIIRCNRV